MANISIKRKFGGRDKKNIAFIAAVSALPLLQFLVFYVYVNINSVLLAFQTKSLTGAGYEWYGLKNFVWAWNNFTQMDKILLYALKNSLIAFLSGVFVGCTLALLFSFYIYKKCPLSSLYKIMLFLPSVLMAIVLVLLFKNFVNFAVPELWKRAFGKSIEGLTSTDDTAFGTVLFYGIWSGFGTQILMYVGAMNNISDSLVEAAELDGANLLQEFWHITLPSVYPTLSTFVVVQAAAFFTSDMNLYSFYGEGASGQVITTGYYLLRETKRATLTGNYPPIACLGLIYTAITLPFVFGIKKLLNKLGPSVE